MSITTENKDNELLDVIQIANEEIAMALLPYAETTPIEPGNQFYVHATRCAMVYLRMLWYERLGQLERSQKQQEYYEKKIEKLMDAITAQKPDRAQTVVLPAKDNLDRVRQTANMDEYTTREFF